MHKHLLKQLGSNLKQEQYWLHNNQSTKHIHLHELIFLFLFLYQCCLASFFYIFWKYIYASKETK